MTPLIILASFIGTISFSILYNIPSKYYISCGFVGVAGWALFALTKTTLGPTWAIFLASSLVMLLARILAVKIRCPEIIFLIAGIFTLVPGADIYWTCYYLVSSQLDKALTSGSNALGACLAMVLGIAIIHELPQSLFSNKKAKKKNG